MTDRIWLKQYPPGVPAEINPDVYSSIVDLFEQCCTQFADKPAVSNFGSELTYRQLDTLSLRFAAYLQQKLGLKHGDRVAIMLPNILQYYVVMFGILRAGLIVVNVNPMYKPREVIHQLKDSGAETIIVMANFAYTLQEALPQTPIKHIIVTELGDLFSFPKSYLYNFVTKYVKRLVPAYHFAESISFSRLMAESLKLHFQKPTIQREDIAYLQYTGGTTGIAKGAVLTHRNMLANVEQVYAWFSTSLLAGQEIIIGPLPLYHVFSLTACTLCFIKFGGKTVLITDPRDIPAFIKELSKIPFTVFIGINTLFNGLMHNPKFSQLKFKHLKLTVEGGMALQTTIAEKWLEMTGNHILEGYGLTETSPVVSVNPVGIKEITESIGLPIPSTDVVIRDEENRDVPIGKEGELCVKGPQVMREYWQQPEETKAVFTADGWLRTGDIAMLDEKGFLYLVDRKKDMILVSGFNVYPNEVEEVIASHPGVLEVAVIGVPSEESGEAVKAYIVKKDPALTADAIKEFCKDELTGYKRPKYIQFVDELPKTNVGKVSRRKLQELEKKLNYTQEG